MLALACCLGIPDVGAQELRVALTLPDGVSRASGILVEAIDAHETVAARAVTGASGLASLRLPRAGSYRVRALRVGFQPTDLGAVVVNEGSVASLVGVLGALTVRLDSIRVTSRTECARGGAGPEDIAAALAQVRTALGASATMSSDGSATAFWHAYHVFTDRSGVPLSSFRVSAFESSSDEPFQSVGADVLLDGGFVRGEGADLVFSAPDARVLLSERFVDTHCFGVGTSHPSQTGWLGVTFDPIQAAVKGSGGLRGTMWLERVSGELRRVEFDFLGTERWLDTNRAKGWIDFQHIDGGPWFVESWGLRIPRPTFIESESPRTIAQERADIVLNVVEFIGASVDSLRRNGQRLYATEAGPETVFPEVSERLGSAPQCDTGGLTTLTNQGMVFGDVVDSVGRILRGQSVQATWLATTGSRFARVSPRESRVFDAPQGFLLACGLPLGVTIQFSMVGDKGEPLKVLLHPSRPYQAVTVVRSTPE